MREALTSSDSYSFKRIRPTFVLLIVALCTVDSGCFVLTSEWRNKPEAPAEAVESHKGSDGKTYSRVFDTREFRLQVTVKNGPVRWEAPFLFYIIPIPTSYDYLATQPLRVDLAMEPRVGQLTFDPWQTLVVTTNHARVPPAHVWENGQWLQTNVSKALPVTTNSSFALEFTPWDQVQPDRALPFKVFIDGLRVSGRSISLPAVAIQPTTHVRAGFQLPY